MVRAAADVMLVPSDVEMFGLVALEASAFATMIVTSGRGGLNDTGVRNARELRTARPPWKLTGQLCALCAFFFFGGGGSVGAQPRPVAAGLARI